MIITEMHISSRTLPYREKDWKIATGGIRAAEMIFVDLITESGLAGQGCTMGGATFISGETQQGIISALEAIKLFIIGKSPFNIEEIMAELDKVFFMNLRAKAAIDMALHDLMGKALNTPLYNLLGGCRQEQIPIIRLIGLKAPKDMASNVVSLVGEGYKAFKVKIGTDFKNDLSRIQAIREAVSQDITITVDMNGAYYPKDAVDLINALKTFNVSLIEQPVNRYDIEGLAFVRRKAGIPIEIDESVMTVKDALTVLRAGAADLISVKILKVGGIRNAKKIATLCNAYGIQCVVGATPGSQLIDVANAHFFVSTLNVWWAAEIGEFVRMEDDVSSVDIIRNGCLNIPKKAGLGIDCFNSVSSISSNRNYTN